ncbi:PEP-CTERM sorting domain-containing protein [Luteolibacter marinus]|uniref:PEP-CTERM sorting domain-containing protein n=1 Tax=Luteolibacter marinus TaxID=2776705 RepID=UPI00186726F8|nr:PEP-CTERM sorting domain-containing protein [Luteolibacter marinus]
MKPSTIVSLFALAGLAATPAARGAVIIESTNNSDGQSEIALNVSVDGAGAVTTGSPWFGLSGSVSQAGAFGGTIGVTFDAAKNMSTSGPTIGDELADGTFDRDDAGFMGVVGNPNAGGIGADATNHEGITIFLDELTDIDPSVGVRIIGINVQNVGRTINATTDPVDESFTVVNLLTRQSLTFVPVAQGLSAGTFDVSSLNMFRVGGDAGAVTAIFSGDVGGFRIDGITIETFAVPEPSVALLGAIGLFGLVRRRR